MTQGEMAGIAVRVLAEQTARKMVRENLRQQGVKLSYVPMRDIISQARAWLAIPATRHRSKVLSDKRKADAASRCVSSSMTHL
jgi:hypothetical protein